MSSWSQLRQIARNKNWYIIISTIWRISTLMYQSPKSQRYKQILKVTPSAEKNHQALRSHLWQVCFFTSQRRRMTPSPLRDVVFLLVRIAKIEPEPEPKPGWFGDLSGVEVWGRLENHCIIDLNQKHKSARKITYNLNHTVGGSPTRFFNKNQAKESNIRFHFMISVFTLPIYSFMGHLNQILATSSSKGKLLVRTNFFRDRVKLKT